MMKTIYRTNALGQLKLQYNVFLGSRSIRLLIYTGLVIMFGIALAVAYSVSLSYIEGEPLKGESFLYEISVFGFSFAQIFFGAAIIAFICSEWTSGFIYTSFGATRRPLNYVLSKLFWPLIFSVVLFTLILLMLIPLEDMLVSRGTPYGISLSDPIAWRQILVANFNLACSILLAAGFALIFRQSASALGVYIAISLIAPIVFGLIPLDISESISDWLPNNVFGYLITQDSLILPKLNYPLLVTAAAAYPIIAITLGLMLFKRKPV